MRQHLLLRQNVGGLAQETKHIAHYTLGMELCEKLQQIIWPVVIFLSFHQHP
jgi:hypothetical protein